MTTETRNALRSILHSTDVCDALDEIALMISEDLATCEAFDDAPTGEHVIPRFVDAYDDTERVLSIDEMIADSLAS